MVCSCGLVQKGLHKGSRKTININSNVYEEVPNDPEPLITTEEKRFEVKDPKFARFYLLLEIHKRLNNVPGRPVISNCGYHMENISAFLDFHLQPLAQAVKSYIKDTNDFLNKLGSFTKIT